MATYVLVGCFACLFATLFLLIFFAVNSEERHIRANERPEPPTEPVSTARRRHLHS